MSGKSRVSDAVWTAFTESLRFVVVPLILIDLVTKTYPQLSTAFMPQIELFVLFFGGMIVASSTLESAHRPGTFKRLLFGLFALALVCMWLFIIFGGGFVEFTYGPYYVELDLEKIVYIVLAGVSLKGVLIFMTFSVSRQAEMERARKARAKDAELAHARAAVLKKAKAAQHVRTLSFENLASAEYDVTADDSVGYAPPEDIKAVPKGMKVCEVCGAQSPTKVYVCKNCGSWFPSETVI